MILLNLCGHDFHYETENLCRVFYPDETIRIVYDAPETGCITARMTETPEGFDFAVRTDRDCETGFLPKNTPDLRDAQELTVATLLYRLLSRQFGYTPPWGILTGVRPSKLMNTLLQDMNEAEAKRYFREKLLVQDGKTDLTAAVARQESRIIETSRPDSFSLYLSIPFCPSRCSYCSFVSHSITGAGAKKLIDPYVKLLVEEIRQCGDIAKELGLHLETVYIGGGTPSILTPEQLDAVCGALCENFPMASAREFTVEAGRPDTITKEKLLSLKRAGVSRISINPQTLNDAVLQRIGRRHTAAEVLESFRLARSLGFDNINMDLIAGLDGDSAESFRQTLCGIIDLSPENITVHTLALKRASRLVTEENGSASGGAVAVAQMLDEVQRQCTESGYIPYYMYRQSRCVGNFENVGWCREGFEGLYNIFMMEETHTVLACGAGAVTKLRDPHSNHLERIFNFKYPYEYISRFDELTARKARIKSFYNEYGF